MTGPAMTGPAMTGRALLVGGGRFVGRRLLDRLLHAGYRVDVLNRGLTRGPADLPPGSRQLVADRTDPVAVGRVLAGRTYDAVFDTSGYRPDEVRSVLEAVTAGRYVYVSTLVVYTALWSADPEVGPLTEDDETVAAYTGGGDVGIHYAGYKRACELVLLAQNRTPVTILRPCGIYGRGDYWYRHDYFFDRAVRGRPILVPESHRDRRVHLTSVAGLAEVALRAAASTGGPEVFNVADTTALTCGELARLCVNATSVAGAVGSEVITYPAGVVDPAGFDARARFPFGDEPGFSLSCRRVRDRLGWPGTDLAEGTAALWLDYELRSSRGEVPEPDLSLDDALLRQLAADTSVST